MEQEQLSVFDNEKVAIYVMKNFMIWLNEEQRRFLERLPHLPPSDTGIILKEMGRLQALYFVRQRIRDLIKEYYNPQEKEDAV